MTLSGLLGLITRMLEDVGIPYMLTGSLAAAYYAIPRATQDIDLVIEASGPALETLTDRVLAAGLYVDADAAVEALSHEGQFNAIDPETGWKVDFIVRKSRQFSVSEFQRRRKRHVLGLELSMVSLEDLIVAKLEWAEKGGSATQLRDVRALVRSAPQDLDRAYIERWIEELNLIRLWDIVQQKPSS